MGDDDFGISAMIAIFLKFEPNITSFDSGLLGPYFRGGILERATSHSFI